MTVERETLAKVEVLADLEPVVHKLMKVHESKRVLWFPSQLLAAPPDTDPDKHLRDLRRRAERRAAPKPARIPSGDRPTYSSDEGLS